MPTAYHVTGAYAGQGGGFIAEYDGALFIVALSAVAVTDSEHSKIGIFKSTDDGETWTRVGSEITLPSSDDSGSSNIAVGDSEWIHGCLDIDFPTSPYAYIIHLDADHNLVVSRLNLDTEDFDATSAAGPSVIHPSETGNHDFLGWMIEQASDGTFGILANLNSAGFATDRVYAMSLSSDLGTWSSRDQVDGQTGSIAYTGTSIARGTDGRVHGLVEVQDGSEIDMYHTVVIGGPGGVGSELQLIAEGEKIFKSPYCGALTSTGDIAFLFASPAAGVGTNYKLSAAHAASADSPTWSIVDVDTTASGFNSYWAALDGVPGGTFRAGYNINDSEDLLRTSVYSGGSWSSPLESSVADVLPFFVSARALTGGVGFAFGNAAVSDYDLYFVLLPIGSGGVQAITGATPISSGERIYNTSGISGGGLETCGEPVPVEVDNSCNPVDPDTAIDAPAECVPQGYSF